MIGTLRHEQAPTARLEMATALLDYGQGKLRIVAKSAPDVERLTAVGQESLVRVKGELVHHSWKIPGAYQRELYEVIPDSIEVLRDARRERMLG